MEMSNLLTKEINSMYSPTQLFENTYEIIILLISTDGKFFVKKDFLRESLITVKTDFLTPLELLYTTVEIELYTRYNISDINFKTSRFFKDANTGMLLLLINLNCEISFSNLKKISKEKLQSKCNFKIKS